jgi:D-galacturonate reductase
MVGTGEYTTGFVGGGASGSDKKVGVVGLTMFDLRRRGKVGKLSMVGTSGSKYPAIRTPSHAVELCDSSFAIEELELTIISR